MPSVVGLLALDAGRPVFEGIGPLGKLAFYLLAALSTAIFAWGVWQRVRKYRRGRPAGRGPVVRRALRERLATVAKGSTVSKGNRLTGLAHFCILWGFVVAFAATVILTVDTDVVRNLSRLVAGHEDSFFHGTFFIVYSFAVDTTGFACLIGVVYMALRRGLRRPARLGYEREAPVPGSSRRAMVAGDWLFLALLLALLITAYLLTGLRILGQHMAWFTVFTPFGRLVAEALSGLGMTPQEALSAHTVLWWVHAGIALTFIAYLPYSKGVHTLVDALCLVSSDRSESLALAGPPAGRPGYTCLEDFTRKQLLELDACTKCGRCHEVCPARTCGATLSPRDLILDLRQWADDRAGVVTLLDREKRPPIAGSAGAGGTGPADLIGAPTLWACTTCMHCVDICPVGIEHVPIVVQLRRSLVDSGVIGEGLQQALQSLATQGNSFGKGARSRARWTKPLVQPIADARKQPVRYLWFVGDYASFDERAQESSRALARVLSAAGIDFGLLYESERDSGNDVRRVGEEGLFELLAEQNISALASASFEEIITTDPHSLNALRNEYPSLGATYPVRHYTEVLAELLESGAIRAGQLGYRVTYHDPCYLARYNAISEAPRRVLRALGCELLEMPRNRADTFCCGAGGGRIWMEDEAPQRPSEVRIKEALALGVDRFVVACPKDQVMFSDALKTTGGEGRMELSEIASLVEEATALGVRGGESLETTRV